MKRLLIVPLILLTACGTSKIPGYDGPKALDRAGVVQGARDCVNNKMKPVVVYLSQKTDHGITPVPVDVQCEVYGPTIR
jgi:hypothetical protein